MSNTLLQAGGQAQARLCFVSDQAEGLSPAYHSGTLPQAWGQV